MRTLANGTGTGYDYDAADQLTAVRHLMNTTSLQRFDYVLDAVGNRTSRQESSTGLQPVTEVYGYDPADQLTEVKYAFDAGTSAHSRKVTYSYDASGNRQSVVEDADGSAPGAPVTVPYVANDLNQYTAIDGLVVPQHDASGNMTLVQFRLGEPGWTYQWDAQNRLIGGSNGLTTFAFAYDGRNRCVARTINGATTVNFYDGWTFIEERSAADVLLAATIHGPGTDEPIVRINAPGTAGEVTVYYHQDGLGSTTALSDANGNVVERVTYDVYGVPSFWDGAGAPIAASAFGNRLLFTGREWLADLRLNDHRNRYYSPDLGRWLSRDPIQESGGWNLYGYCANNCVNMVDRNGKSAGLVARAALMTDVATPEPSDFAWPKWLGWAVVIGIAEAIDALTGEDEDEIPKAIPVPIPDVRPKEAPKQKLCKYIDEVGPVPLGNKICNYECPNGRKGWLTICDSEPCPGALPEDALEFPD